MSREAPVPGITHKAVAKRFKAGEHPASISAALDVPYWWVLVAVRTYTQPYATYRTKKPYRGK